MAVPTPPTAGEPIAEAWGDVVHDAVVAYDIQMGTIVVTTSGGVGSATLTFPRPFASAPNVYVNPNASATDTIQVTCNGNTATTCIVSVKSPTNFGWTVRWMAYGPRA